MLKLVLVAEHPAGGEIRGRADDDDRDHADRGRCIARQFKNSAHSFLLLSHTLPVSPQAEIQAAIRDRGVAFFVELVKWKAWLTSARLGFGSTSTSPRRERVCIAYSALAASGEP